MEPTVRSNNRSGFTLVEFCVSVVIMMVGLLGLLQVVNMANYHNLGNLLRNDGITLADEQMLATKTSVVDAITFTGLGAATSTVPRTTRLGSNTYTVTRAVSAAGTNSKQVLITVSWNYKNKTYNHAISSLITNPVMP